MTKIKLTIFILENNWKHFYLPFISVFHCELILHLIVFCILYICVYCFNNTKHCTYLFAGHCIVALNKLWLETWLWFLYVISPHTGNRNKTRIHSSRMRTARCNGRLSCHARPHTPRHTCPPARTPPPPPWTEWQTLAKILPCFKLRLRAVIMAVKDASSAWNKFCCSVEGSRYWEDLKRWSVGLKCKN